VQDPSGQTRPPRIEAFIIHLARAGQRRAQVQRIAAASPVPAQILDAVDGQLLNKADSDAVYVRRLLRPAYPFALSQAEIACFMSHRRAWREIADRNLDAGLVFEDDVEIDGELFSKAFEAGKKLIGKGCYLQFQVRNVPVKGRIIQRNQDVTVFHPPVAPLRASGQMIDRRAALALLASAERFDRPVDALVQMQWLTGVAVSVVMPSGLTEKSALIGGTTIQQRNKTVMQRIAHEVLRPIYRQSVSRLSLRNYAEAESE
jgi:glycosyl transferase, family 25